MKLQNELIENANRNRDHQINKEGDFLASFND